MSQAMAQQSPERPSARRRLLSGVSLLALIGLFLDLVTSLLKDPVLLIGGLLGLAAAVAGAWWLVTEVGARRWLGAVVLVVGVSVIAVSFLRAMADSDGDVRRLLLLLALLALATSTARAAMIRDLHELDRSRSGLVRPKHPVLICNPKSGGGKVERFGLVALAKDLGVEVILLEPGLDLAQLARDAVSRGADCLGMAGGDGSQALVASIAIESGLPFVCISAGTRNHFALDLGFDKEDPRKGMVALREGVQRHVDYATVGDRLFVNNVSLGIYAAIVQEDGYRDAKVETSMTKLPEMLGRRAEPFDLQFETPDGRLVDGAFLILVSNNPYVMGPSLDISQRRAMDTGTLGVFAVAAESGVAAGRLVARASIGRGTRDPDLHQFDVTSFEVRSRGGHAFAGVDGESLDLPTPLEFRSHPGGLRILVPPANLVAAEKRRARAVSVGALVSIALGRPPAARVEAG
jgi:diacylglycerol kinase family enzyme